MCFWVSVFAITSKNIKRPAKIFFQYLDQKTLELHPKSHFSVITKGSFI